MSKLSVRDQIFNEILDVIRRWNVPSGLAKAVLEEVQYEISRALHDTNIAEISGRLRTRKPRE